jgi:hypothetical protein
MPFCAPGLAFPDSWFPQMECRRATLKGIREELRAYLVLAVTTPRNGLNANRL